MIDHIKSTSDLSRTGVAGDVDLEEAEEKMAAFRAKLAALGVSDARHIINADETGLMYKTMPNYTYVIGDDAHQMRGSRNMAAKDRVTVQLLATADGIKGPAFVIGKQAKPRCFTGATLPADVHYSNQISAWMDRAQCQYWIDNVLTPWKRSILGEEKVWKGSGRG
jgi:hypothetical protein